MFKKSYLVKVPSDSRIYVNSQKRILLIKSNFNESLLKIKNDNLKLLKIKNKKNFLSIVSKSKKNKNLKTLYKKNLLNIKKLFFNTISKNWKKLKLQGIGYKFSIISNKHVNILHLKLGYSHSVYVKLPNFIIVKLTNNNVLFLQSNSIEKLLLVSELIKNCKRPDPYKGKGILYVNENINLKIGKKS